MEFTHPKVNGSPDKGMCYGTCSPS